MNVLLLDSGDGQSGARQALEACGAAVVLASGVSDALAEIQTRIPDVVVVGPALALDFIKALRATGSGLPVVAIAHLNDLARALECLQVGADDCIAMEPDATRSLAEATERAHQLAGADARERDLQRQLVAKELELGAAERRIVEFQHMAVTAQKTGNVVGLVRGVCHELNNPLTGILGYAQLLQEVWEGEGVDDLKEIESCAQRCRDIIGRLARFCRVEKAVLTPVQVNEVLSETLHFVEYFANRHRAKVIVELAADLPETVGYGSELRHVFVAVLVNGIQAMQGKRGGVLTVKTFVRDGGIHLEVNDTGEGIPPENLDLIFHPFFTTRDPSEASGMGLAVAREVVQAHQGTIQVDSTPGIGTTVSIVMPVRAVATPADEAVAAKA